MFLALSLSSEMILNGSVLGDLELFLLLSHLIWNFLALLILILSHQFKFGRDWHHPVGRLGKKYCSQRWSNSTKSHPPTPTYPETEWLRDGVCVCMCVYAHVLHRKGLSAAFPVVTGSTNCVTENAKHACVRAQTRAHGAHASLNSVV